MRRMKILRPPRLRFLARKPCLRFRLRWEGWYSVPRAAKRTWSWKRGFIVCGGVNTLLASRENIGGTWFFGWEFKANSCFVALNIGRGGGRRMVLTSISGIRGMSDREWYVTHHAHHAYTISYVRKSPTAFFLQPHLTLTRVNYQLCPAISVNG